MTRIAIDFGTSHTVAIIAVEGRPPTPLLFDGSPLLPSAVWADQSGRLVVGRDALHAAQADPSAFEPSPKRRIDEDSLLLGRVVLTVEDVIGAVFAHVAAEARQVAGGPVTHASVTYPAAWAAPRRARLESAARRVFPDVTLVSEPIAAASYVVCRSAGRIPPGGAALVYDFGAGTFDASVVRADAHGGLTVAATEGLDDTGGLDVDAVIVGHLQTVYGRYDPDAWARLAAPVSRADQRARRALWDAARAAKEVLTRAPYTVIPLPVGNREAPLGREQLEELARPVLARTVQTALRVTEAAGRPGGVFLVGGASRMPLAASLLHRALGVPPSLLDQPELVVAEGALYATEPPAPVPAAVFASASVPMSPAAPTTNPPRVRRAPLIIGAGAVTLMLALVGATLLRPDTPLVGPTGGPTAPSSAARSTAASSAGEGAAEEAPPGRDPAAPAPPSQGVVDPCLVGTWAKVRHEMEVDIDGTEVEITGPGGGTVVYRADGTYTDTYQDSGALTAIRDGVTWEYRFSGELAGRYQAYLGRMALSDPSSDGTVEIKRNGQVERTAPYTAAHGGNEADYYCERTELEIYWGDITMALQRKE